MFNLELLWYLLIPLPLTVVTLLLLHRWVAGISWGQAAGAALFGLFLSAAILSSAFYLGRASKTDDQEILNGALTGKVRQQGSYQHTYECQCQDVTSGSGKNRSTHRSCRTCTEWHYTVDWRARSTVGDIPIDSRDWTSPAVYLLPDPTLYRRATPGEPVAKVKGYTNYIRAVPDSLFRPAAQSLKERYQGQLPAYPIGLYDLYRVDRVLPVGLSIPDLPLWNQLLSQRLITLGPQKQANAVIVITKASDPEYAYALQDAWVNGKKNDIVLIIGAPDFPHPAAWVRVLALATDNTFQVRLRDAVLALPELTAQAVIDTLTQETMQGFHRKRMHEFQYLEAEIDPPDWVMNSTTAALLLVYALFWIYTYHNRDARGFSRYGIPRARFDTYRRRFS